MKEPRIFKIPSDNLPVLADKFKKLARRAKRLNLPPPTYTELKVERIEKDNGDVYLLHHITVDPGISCVKVDGWEFVATIQHTEEGNIIRAIAGQEIPQQYRNTTNYCDHCKQNRYRKDTYVLRKIE